MKFRVIGVLEKQGKFLGLFSVDKQAVLPLGAFKKNFFKTRLDALKRKSAGR